MKTKLLPLAVAFLFSSLVQAAPPKNVILMMIDGVRWQEIFDTPMIAFPPYGAITGNVRKAQAMTVANPVNISLPAYQSIMAGATQPCRTNDCGRIGVETLEERLVRELRLAPTQVATIASWENIKFAVEHREGSTFVNAGQVALDDGTGDPELERLNREQAAAGQRWEACRNDELTFAQALRYLKANRPRFLYISLNDTDEWAHAGDFAKYAAQIRQSGAWLRQLLDTLATMGEYGANTTLLLTTDHGRGTGDRWHGHGDWAPESKYVWLYSTDDTATRVHTHADIRGAIERIFGLKPLRQGRRGD